MGKLETTVRNGAMLGNETLAMAETKVVKTTGSEAVKEARGQKVGRTLHVCCNDQELRKLAGGV